MLNDAADRIRCLPVILALGLSACATQPTPVRTTHTTSPVSTSASQERIPPGHVRGYSVFGQRYYILASSAGYQETGTASWYGPKFNGRPTANGEVFDMHDMTAAHKSLPLPTYVRVTHLDNQRSIIVRVNDRGPFIDDRLIDLSYAAAVELDMIGPGTGRVLVTALDASESAALADFEDPPAPRYTDAVAYIQVGAFSNTLNAGKMAEQLEHSGFRDVIIQSIELNGQIMQRVKIGPLSTSDDRQGLLNRLINMGLDNARIVSQ